MFWSRVVLKHQAAESPQRDSSLPARVVTSIGLHRYTLEVENKSLAQIP